MIDLLELHAREKGRLPDNWFAYLYNVLSDGDLFSVTGVVAPLTQRGKRKGKPNFAKKIFTTKQTIYINAQEHAAFKSAWSAKTGLCNMCGGEGRLFVRWNIVTGREYEKCATCKGSGKV